MATGINFTPEGVPELNRALETLDKLTTSVGKLAGTGKSLEELRRIIVGVGASGSALGQLQNSIRELSSVVQGLPEQLRTAMSGMSAAGMSAGKALGEGVEKGAKESLARAKSAVRQEINELQMQYEAAVAKGWSFKPTALTGMKTLGISLFPSDRELLAEVNAETARLQTALKAGDASSSMAAAAAEDMRKVSLARGKAQLAAFKEVTEAANAQIVAEAKSEQARLQTALKAMDESSAAQAADASSIRKVSLARGKAQLAVFKEVTETANAQIVAEAKSEQARLQTALKAMDESSAAQAADASSIRKVSLARGKAQLAAFKEVTEAANAQIMAEAKSEQARLQTALKAMDESSAAQAADASSIRKVSLARGKAQLAVFKEVTETANAQIVAEAKSEQARLQTALKAMDESSAAQAADASSIRKVSLARGKAQLAAFKEVTEAANAQIMAEAKSEQARLQTALKAMDESSAAQAADASSIRKVSLARGKAQLAAFKEVTEAANAQIVAEAKAAQARLDAQLQALYARGARQSLVATAQASGGYSSLSTGKEVTPAVADPVKVGSSTEALKKQSSALQQFAQHANEAHSAARGLASGLGLLWLTWGSMVPLLAGAAISNAVVQMVKLGAAVEQTLSIIGTLGGEGAEGVKALHAELLKVSSGGVFGPLAVAEALKTMAMAGLDAKQQIAALGAVLQFAQLGEMPTKQAAETLSAIAQAFGYSARDWSRVGDIITATAAATTATIADMSAAFKSSSVVAQEYGVSLTDAAAALGVLNQIGIRGTAGGTAMRQMYNELIGSSAQARKTIEALGIQVMTADKQALRPFREITLEVVKGLSGLNGLGQMRALQSMMNERGMKAEVAAMAAYRAEQKALGKSSEETILGLQQLMDKIADSPGIMAIATAQLAHSSENLMKGVKSSLQTSLVEAFDALQPTLAQISLSLTRSFGSAEFKSALVSLADGVATFTRVVVENFNAIANLAQAYVLWRVGLAGVTLAAGAASTVLTALAAAKAAAALGASGLAAGATSLANAVLGTSVAFTGLQLALGAVGIVIVAVGAALAYMAFKEGEADRARRERVAALAAGSAITEKALDDEIARLSLLIKKMKEGGTEQQAQAEARTALVLAEISERYAILKATEQQIIASNQEAIAKERAAGGGKTGPVDTTAVYSAALGQAELRLRELNKEEFKSLERISAKTSAVKALAREYADAADKAAKANLASPKGTADFNKPTKPGPVHAADYNFTKDILTEEKARHSALMQELKREATDEKQLLDAKHRALILGEADYQTQSLVAIITADTKQTDAIEQGWVTRNELISKALGKIANEAGGFEKLVEASNKVGDAFAALDPKTKALAEGYRKLLVDQGLSNEEYTKEIVTLRQVISTREKLLSVDLRKGINEQAKAIDALSLSADVNLQKQKDKLALDIKMQDMSDVQRAGLSAEQAFRDAAAQGIAKQEEELRKLVVQLQGYQDAIRLVKSEQGDDAMGLVKLAQDAGLTADGIEMLRAKLAALKSQVAAGGGVASITAELEQARKETIALRDDLAKALTDGVMKGRDAAKSIWITLRDWLKNLFANTVLKPVFQTVVGGAMNSLLGSATSSAASSAASSSLGNMFGSATGSAAGDSGILGSIGTAVSTAMMPAVDAIAGAVGYTGGISAAGGTLAQFSAGSAMMADLAVAAPYIAAALAVAYALTTKATPHVGGYALSDAAGNVTDITAQQQGKQDAGVQKAMADVAKSSAALLNTFSAKFGGTGGFSVRAVLESDKNDGSWALYHLLKDGVKQAGSFDATPQAVGGSGTLDKDPTKAAEQFATMTAQAMRTSMETLDLPGWAKKQLDALGTEFSTSDLANAATSIYATQDSIVALQKTVKPMAGSLGQLANSSSDTLFNLAQLAGGFDQLTSTLGTYYTNYYSAAEQQGAALSNLTAQYKELNMGALPTTKEAFRGVIDSFVAGGGRAQEGGEKTYLTLMQLANGFAALDSNAQDLTKQTDLQISMLRAQGKESAAVAIERQREIDALSKTNPELVDMQKNLYALTDAASLKTARDDLQIQIDRALGDEVGALAIERQRELLALQNTHPELISLQQQLYNLADAATAAAAATKLYDAASAAQDKFLTDVQKSDKGYHTVAQTLIKAGNTSSEDSLVTMLKGLTKQDIYDLATSFITMSNASVEAKTSVAEAAGSLADLKDAAAQLAYDTTKAGMEKTIAEMTKQYGDLQTAMDLINPPLKTISQQYTDNAAALKTLSDSLDVLLGTAKKTPQEILSDMLTSQKALKDARSSVKDAIFSSRLAGMTPKDKAAALREQEAGLYSQLRTAADPAAVVSKLQSVILERVKAEAAIQVATAAIVVTAAEQEASLAKVARDAQLDSLKSQLDGFKKLKDLAANMGQFIGELKFSDLSSQNYADQLNAAQSLYYTTLDKARNGDANAVANVQGNASAYLKEAQSYYGGATAPYNAIFEGVLSSLNQLGLDAQNVDPQIAALQVQIDKMSAINAALDALNATAVSTSKEEVLALEALDTAIAARQEADAAAIAEQTQIAKEQLAVLEEQQKTLKEQILQQGKIYTDLIASLNKLNDNFEKAQKNANMEAAKP